MSEYLTLNNKNHERTQIIKEYINYGNKKLTTSRLGQNNFFTNNNITKQLLLNRKVKRNTHHQSMYNTQIALQQLISHEPIL